MAIVYADQVSEIAIRALYAGREHVNVLHYVNDESAVNDETKARDILDNWQDHIMASLSDQYVLQGATWRSLDRNDLNQGTLAPDPAKRTSGASAATAAPPHVCFLVKKITTGRQRGQRDGRMFLSGVAEIVVDAAGHLSAAHQADMNADLQAFFDGVTDLDVSQNSTSGLVVLNTTPASREPGTVEVDLTYRRVSDLVLDPVVSSQRDRLR